MELEEFLLRLDQNHEKATLTLIMSFNARMNQGAIVGTGNGIARRRPRTAVFFILLCTSVLFACSGKIVETTDDDDLGSGGSGGTTPTGGGNGSGGEWVLTGGSPATGGSEPYMDPECPDEAAPEPYVECDPLEPKQDCPDGYGCYPYLEYPFGEGCGHATYGAICIPAGEGEQGEFCDDSYCAPGFMCVVGATGGRRCGQICEPVRDHQCPDGLICGRTDVQGYGVCF